MPDPSLNGEPISKRCSHCNNLLFRIVINPHTLNSPFKKDNPAIVCEVCDAPGKLPKVPR